MTYVVGLSIKEAFELKVDDVLENVLENGPRPTALVGVIKSLPKLEDNPVLTQDYYCDIEVDGHISKCRLTFVEIWKDVPCSFCGWSEGEHSEGCLYDL